MKAGALVLISMFLATVVDVSAQITNPEELLGQDNAITTAVPFLAITPDARHAALGDAGVASSPDASSAYWNPAKLAFIDKKYGGALSYTPWLGKIVNDMSISYLSGFYKLSRSRALGFGIKYFDMGDITFTNGPNPADIQGTYNPREAAFEVTYSQKLTEELSIGGSARYIFSNVTGGFTGVDARPGHSVAADVGLFYTKPLKTSARNSELSLGASFSNIGAKISYTNAENENFLPGNFRLGGAYTTELDLYNKITFLLDFNKLLVPTPPIRDPDTDEILFGKDDDRSLLSGIFGSFADAPDGAREELNEVMTSMGIEYWYDNTFAARLGYFNEARTKGNRKYLTAGVGFRKNNFGIDVAYIVPTNRREHPLAETLRFTIMFHLAQSPTESDDSVTE